MPPLPWHSSPAVSPSNEASSNLEDDKDLEYFNVVNNNVTDELHLLAEKLAYQMAEGLSHVKDCMFKVGSSCFV